MSVESELKIVRITKETDEKIKEYLNYNEGETYDIVINRILELAKKANPKSED